MKKRIAILSMLGMMPWVALLAQQQATTTFKVSARVDAFCLITALDLNFGIYTGQAGVQRIGSTQMQATCTPGTTYNVGLNEGTTPGATINQRKLALGSNTLDYQLYSDSARSIIWGNTPGTDTMTGVGNGLAYDFTIYGAIPAGQAVPAGEYADTITVRVYY
jgi:spore coat protein U-like protein